MPKLTKEEKEKRIFDAFTAIEPNFAGEKVSCRQGQKNQPPDFFCKGEGNREIGVELVEWLHPFQMTRSSSLIQLEREIRKIVPSDAVKNLINSNDIVLCTQEDMFPSKIDRSKFSIQLYEYFDMIINSIFIFNEEIQFDNFDSYPILNKYLKYIMISPSNYNGGIGFIMGGDYSPNNALNALDLNIREKINKKNYPALKQSLSELYLIVYYSSASYHNSPYRPDYNEENVASLAIKRLAYINNLFDKIFLFFALEPKLKVFTLYSK